MYRSSSSLLCDNVPALQIGKKEGSDGILQSLPYNVSAREQTLKRYKEEDDVNIKRDCHSYSWFCPAV